MSTPAAVTTAAVFPGQGSQRAGMGRDFHESFAASRDVFAEASEALGLDVAALCFEDDPRLDQTEFTQPAILTVELAMMRALEAEYGFAPSYFGGHSLGEYTALAAAGVLPLADAVRITRRRGALMQAAVPLGEGAMSAVIADGIARRDLSDLSLLGVDVANRNSNAQVVLSGPAAAVAAATEALERRLEGTEHRIVPLRVSAPFHSRGMKAIEPEFRDVLLEAAPRLRVENAARVTSNFRGGFHEPNAEAIVEALVRQISGTVDWIANMNALAAAAPRIVEVGPNRPLRGFFATLGREVASIVSVKAAAKELGR